MKQTQLVKQFFEHTGMIDTKPVGSLIDAPIITRKNLHKPLTSDTHTIFRIIVGGLMYFATRARPDLCVATSMFGLYVYAPTSAYMLD